MKRTIVVEVECEDVTNPQLERGTARALLDHYEKLVTVINVEAADWTPAEAFGIGKERRNEV